MSDRDPLDVDAVVTHLNAALRLQYRSAIAYTLAAGSLSGFAFHALAADLARFAALELDDARRLVEKVTAIGGDPTTEVAEASGLAGPEDAVARLIEDETEAIEALQAVIPHTGNQGRSEALEHRLEHIIMRKQEQVDALLRAARR